MRSPTLLLLVASAAALTAPSAVSSARGETPAAAEEFRGKVRPFLDKYCSDCHDGPKAKADVDLGQFEEMRTLWRNPKLWEKGAVQLEDKVMPPARKKQPADEERVELLKGVQKTLKNPDRAR